MAEPLNKSFRTVYDRIRKFTCPGNRFEPTYKLKVSDDGRTELEIVGQTDCYAYIQSHKDSVDLNLTLQRFAKGDEQAINKVQGIYGDFTNMPKTLAELSQRVLDAQALFDSLPVDVRRDFNHSPAQFFASMGTEQFNGVVSKFYGAPDQELGVKVSTPIKEGDVVNNEKSE